MNDIQLKAIVVSRNFNPGHYSHLLASYKVLSENNINTYMYHHALFNNMSVIDKKRVFNNISELKALGKVDLAIFWFPSFKNILDTIFLRLFYRTQVVYVFHEPYESVRAYLDAGFGYLKTFKIVLISSVNYLLILLSSKVVLPSRKSLNTYETKYLHTNKKYVLIPLLFDDEASQIKNGSERFNISYIGTVAEDHAFDEFVTFAVHAIKNNWFPKYKFLIATKSNLPLAQRVALTPYITSGNVVIEEGKPMSNESINEHYNNSVVVWNAYRRSMQSGVLPKAYMFGAPLIVSSSNLSEFFQDRQHGVMINSRYDINELKESVNNVIVNFEKYSLNCRSTFMTTFYYKAYEKVFMDFILDEKKVEQ